MNATASTLLALTALSLSYAATADAAPPAAKGKQATPRAARRGLQASSLSPRLGEAVDLGLAPANEEHDVVVSLGLRNRDDLEQFLRDVQDPGSPRYQQFLTQEEFDALYGPTSSDEEAVVNHLLAHGFEVTHRSDNRLVVGARGRVVAMEQAFGVQIHHVAHGGKRHFAAVNEPSLPAELAPSVAGIVGLDDLGEMTPNLVDAAGNLIDGATADMQWSASVGTGAFSFGPADIKTFYNGVTGYTGSSQIIVIAGAYAWNANDVKAFTLKFGLATLSGSQVCTGLRGSLGCLYDATRSLEVSLDVEYAHAVAPAAKIYNYMAGSTSFTDFATMYNKIVSANPGKIITTSWGACEATMSASLQLTNDNIFANANAKGQSWFAASGDRGSLGCNGTTSVLFPANSPHVIGVGGTSPQCSSGLDALNPACGGYAWERGWSGSGGGVSQLFARPTFQTGYGMPEGTQRLVPDVALDADPAPGKFVYMGGTWRVVGGTSGAAPEMAGLFAQILQRKLAGKIGVGNPGARLYALSTTVPTVYHDIVDGSNGDYSAGPGYDLVTGLGSVDAKTLVTNY